MGGAHSLRHTEDISQIAVSVNNTILKQEWKSSPSTGNWELRKVQEHYHLCPSFANHK